MSENLKGFLKSYVKVDKLDPYGADIFGKKENFTVTLQE